MKLAKEALTLDLKNGKSWCTFARVCACAQSPSRVLADMVGNAHLKLFFAQGVSSPPWGRSFLWVHGDSSSLVLGERVTRATAGVCWGICLRMTECVSPGRD